MWLLHPLPVQRQVKSQAPDLEYGETAYIQNSSYFLGQLSHGQTIQSFENNLYRTPLYNHTPSFSDFLLIVSGDMVHVREIDALFLQGQQCPKVEVPAPNSKSSTAFQKDLLQVLGYCIIIQCFLYFNNYASACYYWFVLSWKFFLCIWVFFFAKFSASQNQCKL